MKKLVSFILCATLVLCCTSCAYIFPQPDTVTIEGTLYKRAFVSELFPVDDCVSTDSVSIAGNSYFEYPNAQYDCYISYDRNAQPNVYFPSEQYHEAVSYYTDPNHFTFYCLIGNIHDTNQQEVSVIQNIDAPMFARLLEFSSKNEYNPLTLFNKEDGLVKVPIANPDNWTADEIHFYKESNDGAFSTSKGYTFIMHDGKLSLLYQYDWGDDNAPEMLLRSVPTEISDYFCTLLKELQNK